MLDRRHRRNRVFTTGTAAKAAMVSQQTIIRVFDNESLDGYRVPNSKFRRITYDSLRDFMLDCGISLGNLDGERNRFLVVWGAQTDLRKSDPPLPLRLFFTEEDSCGPDSGFECGVLLARERPDLLLIDRKTIPLQQVNAALSSLKSQKRYQRCKAVVLAEQAEHEELLTNGAECCCEPQIEVEHLYKLLCNLLEDAPRED